MAKNYTSKTVAQLTGLSHRRVLQYCLMYDVPKFGNVYVLTDKHVNDLNRRRRQCTSTPTK